MRDDSATPGNGEEPAAEEPRPFLVTASPHLRSPESIPRIMWTVVATLLPAIGWGVYVFGPRVLWLVFLGVASAAVAEAACQVLRKRPITVSDGSAVLTGIFVVLVFPVHVPWYVIVAGSVFGVAIAKHAFGGLGCNIWNPALAGRAFVLASWTALVTVGAGWPVAFHYQKQADAVTAATPLTRMKQGVRQDLKKRNEAVQAQIRDYNGKVEQKAIAPTREENAAQALHRGGQVTVPTTRAEAAEALAALRERSGTPLTDLILGRVGGCVGEVSAVALLAGGLVLLVLGHIRWQIPVFYLGTVALLAWAVPTAVQGADLVPSATGGAYLAEPTTYYVFGQPLFHLFAGGLFLGAFFMATDMVTSPVTGKGQAVFAIGCGVLTVVIRRFGGYPEGVCYAILLMNTASPLIDRYTRRKAFGRRPKSNE